MFRQMVRDMRKVDQGYAYGRFYPQDYPCPTRQESAEERAEALLRSILSPEQRQEYNNRRQITVVGSLGGQYVICRQHSFNVRGSSGERYCCVPGGHLPLSDNIIGQMLLIETDERLFLEQANVRSWRREVPPFDPDLGWDGPSMIVNGRLQTTRYEEQKIEAGKMSLELSCRVDYTLSNGNRYWVYAHSPGVISLDWQ